MLEKVKEIIGIEQFGDTKISIHTNNKLLDDISFKNVVILMTCIIKVYSKFYLQMFLEEALA